MAGWFDPADTRTLAARTAQAVAAGLFCLRGAGLPDEGELDRLRGRTGPGWPEIARAAVASGDHHVQKLAHAARVEEAATGDRLYRWLAARQVGLG